MSKKQTITMYLDVAPTDNYEWESITIIRQISQPQGYHVPELLKGWRRYRVQFEVPKHKSFVEELTGDVLVQLEKSDG